MRFTRSALLSALSLICAASLARAQVSETPVPLDSAGTLWSIAPALAARLGLMPPAWPVRSEFLEARLFAGSDGSWVLVADRQGGRRDRYPMSVDQVAELRHAVSAAMEQTGKGSGVAAEDADVGGAARGAFVRDAMLNTAFWYGPSLGVLTHDATAGPAAYLAAVGASFFVASAISSQTTITRPENTLISDGAFRGGAVVLAALYAGGANPSTDQAAGSFLVGGIGASIAGYAYGKSLTESEAQAAASASTFGALTAYGIGRSLLATADAGRVAAGMAVAGAVAGYVLGPDYPRRVPYRVTSGDIELLNVSAFLGAMTAAIPVTLPSHVGSAALPVALTAGMLGGLWVGNNVFVRDYDYTDGEAALVIYGTFAGGLLGGAIPLMNKNGSVPFILTCVTGGAYIGAFAAEQLVKPAQAAVGARRGNGGLTTRLSFDPSALALTLGRVPGAHAFATLFF